MFTSRRLHLCICVFSLFINLMAASVIIAVPGLSQATEPKVQTRTSDAWSPSYLIFLRYLAWGVSPSRPPQYEVPPSSYRNPPKQWPRESVHAYAGHTRNTSSKAAPICPVQCSRGYRSVWVAEMLHADVYWTLGVHLTAETWSTWWPLGQGSDRGLLRVPGGPPCNGCEMPSDEVRSSG